MSTFPNRQPQGIPTGGRFAAALRAEPSTGLKHTNRYARIDDIRELDSAASSSLSPENLSCDGELSAAEQAVSAEGIRRDWGQRREQIFAEKRRKTADEYAERLEIAADQMLDKAAAANLRNIADGILEKHPDASTMTLARDYDDGNLAIYVESVRDKNGTDLGNPESYAPDARDTAQELVSEYSSRQLSRFVDRGPVNLAEAAAWTPDSTAGFLG